MVTNSRAPSRWLAWWLRWSWRDFRSHWIAVLAIALVLAIGTGVYAGLGSTAEWRRQSNDASFAALEMHDLRVTLSPGTFVEQGALLGAIASIDDADSVSGVTERLVVDSQVDTGVISGADSVLVPARLVGMTFHSARPVDDVWVRDGTAPSGDPTDRSAVLEAKFADQRSLPSEGTVLVAGGRAVNYTGLGVAPEDFFYEGPEGTIFAAGELAIMYLPLAAAQDVSGHEGMVNDAALVLVDGADRDAIEAQLTEAASDLGVSATVSTREEADAVRVLYEDIDNDQRFWNALSALVLLAAALAAFNLINRIVEAQRREIGIGMALGVPRPQLAIRPMLIGVQEDLLRTVHEFERRFGSVSGNILVAGVSEGAAVAVLAGERYPRLFDGVLAACGPIGGFRTQLDHLNDFRVLFDYFFPGVISGTPIDVPDAVVQAWLAGTLRNQVLAALQADPAAAVALFAAAGITLPPGPPPAYVAEFTLRLLAYNILGTGDVQARIGQPYDNTGTVYPPPVVNAAVPRFVAEQRALSQLKKYETDGRLNIPVVTIHNPFDPIVPFQQVGLYEDKVEAAGAEALLTAYSVTLESPFGHCVFTLGEVQGALALLASQVSAGAVAAR